MANELEVAFRSGFEKEAVSMAGLRKMMDSGYLQRMLPKGKYNQVKEVIESGGRGRYLPLEGYSTGKGYNVNAGGKMQDIANNLDELSQVGRKSKPSKAQPAAEKANDILDEVMRQQKA